MTAIPDEVRAQLEAPNYWLLATLNPDGHPQVNPMWIHVEGDHVVVNTSIGRQKEKNVRRDPRVTIATTDDGNPYAYTEIRGKVVKYIEGDEAEASIDMLAKKYIGEDVYPWRQEGERRVKLLVEPTRINRWNP
jgi:PPOX class probable F420-dependent enzyme